MLSLSAKTVNLSALPSPSVSSQITMRSRPSPGRLQLVGIVDASRRSTAGRARPRSCRSACRCPARRRTARTSKPPGHDHVLHRLGRRQRLLHLADRLALRCPTSARRACSRDLRAGRPAYSNGFERPSGDPRPAVEDLGPCPPPSGCRARPGPGSRGCPRSGRRGPRRCRRRGPCPACGPTSTAPSPSPSTRYSRTVRSFSLCLVWT